MAVELDSFDPRGRACHINPLVNLRAACSIVEIVIACQPVVRNLVSFWLVVVVVVEPPEQHFAQDFVVRLSGILVFITLEQAQRCGLTSDKGCD